MARKPQRSDDGGDRARADVIAVTGALLAEATAWKVVRLSHGRGHQRSRDHQIWRSKPVTLSPNTSCGADSGRERNLGLIAVDIRQ